MVFPLSLQQRHIMIFPPNSLGIRYFLAIPRDAA